MTMTPAGGPLNPIQILFRRDFCDRHLRPFKRHWPKGSAVFVSLIFQAFVQVDAVLEFARDGGDMGQADRLPLAMQEFGPMCCAIDHQTLHDVRAYALNPSDRTKSRLVVALMDETEDDPNQND